VVCYRIDSLLFSLVVADADWLARVVVPLIEEVLKAAYVLWLIRTARVGFMVDAAICGSAAGAGFSLIENVYYIRVLAESGLTVWTLRGFGTAIMHGGTTAIVSVVAAGAPDSTGRKQMLRFVPGLALAVAIHMAWNFGLMTPPESSLIALLDLPILFVAVFARRERDLNRWMGLRLDHDLELLKVVRAGIYGESRTARYLLSLQKLPAPEMRVNVFRLLELSVELSGFAKGNMIRVASRMPALSDPAIVLQMRELRELEKRVGPAALRALAPLRTRSTRDLWELNQLDS
jgi:hypothetical protein